MSDQPRGLIEVCTFSNASEMFDGGGDVLAKLIAEAEQRAKAAQTADAKQPKPPAEPTRTLLAVFGARACGWFA